MKDYIVTEKIKPGDKIHRTKIKTWFQTNYPKIKIGTIDAHIRLITTNAQSRINHRISTDGADDLFFQLADGYLRLYDKNTDPQPIYKSDINSENPIIDESEEENINESAQEFAYEKDLKNFLSKNLSIIEEGLTLYDDDEGITGLEYEAGGRYIDILAIDKNNDYVVIELKVSRGYDRVIGQLLRYIGWIKANLAESNQNVRGIIIARTITQDLKIACTQINKVNLFEYNLSVSLKEII